MFSPSTDRVKRGQQWRYNFVLDPCGVKRVPKGRQWRYNFVLDPRGAKRVAKAKSGGTILSWIRVVRNGFRRAKSGSTILSWIRVVLDARFRNHFFPGAGARRCLTVVHRYRGFLFSRGGGA